MDKQREKLIDLIQNSVGYCATYWATRIADHLLADKEIKHAFELLKAEKEGRLIVPPCKVGDTVYRLYYDELCEATVVDIEINYYTNPQYWLTIEYYSKSIGKHSYKSRIDLILGKTVFLSREDAEKALKVLKAVE